MKITGQISDSEEDQKIWNYIKENQLESKVIFTGFKYGVELEDLISKATCVVCPAIWYENMPNTVIEAYAYGKPVVASRIGSLAEHEKVRNAMYNSYTLLFSRTNDRRGKMIDLV